MWIRYLLYILFGIQWCSHVELTYPVDSTGYQYCKECGRAFKPPKKDCEHIWEEEAKWENFD